MPLLTKLLNIWAYPAQTQRARARVASIWQAKLWAFLMSAIRLVSSCHEVHYQPQHNTTYEERQAADDQDNLQYHSKSGL